jgi:hypothetical protein
VVVFNKCLWCGKSCKHSYCTLSHKSMHNQRKREDKINAVSPEDFIARELAKPVVEYSFGVAEIVNTFPAHHREIIGDVISLYKIMSVGETRRFKVNYNQTHLRFRRTFEKLGFDAIFVIKREGEHFYCYIMKLDKEAGGQVMRLHEEIDADIFEALEKNHDKYLKEIGIEPKEVDEKKSTELEDKK